MNSLLYPCKTKGQQHSPVEYEVIYSSRKTLAIQVTSKGQILVRAPKQTSQELIERFLSEKENWIRKHQKEAKENTLPDPPRFSETRRRRYIELARRIFTKKTAHYASVLRVTYGRISIREQKTRWGSCSSAGNLNYNWRLIFAPEEVVDYIVIHELAHRIEMNHSPAFYQVVASVMPDYKKQQTWLKEHGTSLYYCSHPVCFNCR